GFSIMASKFSALSLVIIFFFLVIFSGKTESKPFIYQQCSSNQQSKALQECQSREKYQIKQSLNQYCGYSSDCAKNMNKIKFVNHGIDAVEYSNTNFSCPLRVLGTYRWSIIYLILNIVDIMINGRI
ncbi:hypothetical protein PanWU01x14_156800, partial [Parasponia andersonii]